MGARIEMKPKSKEFISSYVAPLVGARIEIVTRTNLLSVPRVAPLVGARIEIEMKKELAEHEQSLPSWERGLKSVLPGATGKCRSRSPRGSAD